MGVKGQSQLLVPVVGLSLGIMLSLIPVFILDYTVTVSVNNVENNYGDYESSVYSFIYVSKGETSRITKSQAQDLREGDEECKVEDIAGRKILFDKKNDDDEGKCKEPSGSKSTLSLWISDSEPSNSEMEEIWTKEVNN